MPKKHSPSYAQTKPSYVHPSLQSSRVPESAGSSSPPTVNQRIQQLRREQAPRATPEQRDELTSVVSRTVPPELRRILQMPEVNAPKPKAGSRARRIRGAARPPPGPAAPTSWLQRSRHAPAHMRRRRHSLVENEVARFCPLARVTDEELKRLPSPRSLVHYCLRSFARHWRELSEYEQHYLPELPVGLKEALLSYLTLFGSKGCVDFKSFKILFQNDDGTGTMGWDETQFIDLTDLLNEHFTVADLGKCFKRPVNQVIQHLETIGLSDDKPSNVKALAESWEEEAEEPSAAPPGLVVKLQTPIFTNLSRLSLSHPGQWASWPDLLRVSSNFNKLTHLSLAYWPRPTMTPNATTASMVSKHTSVSLGGSHLYSDLDEDYHEAANIIRRLSINTYSLQWLDLEGCHWLSALTWNTASLAGAPNRLFEDSETPWQINSASPGPDFTDTWRRITYLNLFQGWIPCDKQSLQNMPAGIVPVQLMRWLREHEDDEDQRWKLDSEQTGYAVAEWLHREKLARSIGRDINRVRREGEGPWCQIDHAWHYGAAQ